MTDPGQQFRPRLESLANSANALLGSAARMRRELGELAAKTSSEDGFVVTTVDARGRLVDLELDPRVYRVPNARALSNQVLETYQRAVDQVEDEARTLMRSYLPPEIDPDTFLSVDLDAHAAPSPPPRRGGQR